MNFKEERKLYVTVDTNGEVTLAAGGAPLDAFSRDHAEEIVLDLFDVDVPDGCEGRVILEMMGISVVLMTSEHEKKLNELYDDLLSDAFC